MRTCRYVPAPLPSGAYRGRASSDGSSDDDPSGIQTHSQTGAQFGYSQLWMAAIAMITLVGSNRAIMGRHVNNWFANLMGWAVVVIMGVCALALIGSLVAGA